MGNADVFTRLGANHVYFVCGDEAKRGCGVEQYHVPPLRPVSKEVFMQLVSYGKQHMQQKRDGESCW